MTIQETARPAESLTPPPLRLTVDADMTLDRFQPEDAQVIYDLVDKNREFLGRTQPGFLGLTRDMATGFVAMMSRNADLGISAPYLMDYRGTAIGAIQFTGREGSTATMGFWVAEAFQGQGLVSQAASRLRDFGFDEWGLTEVKLEIGENNDRSERLAIRLGAALTDEPAKEPGERVWTITKHE